jgi:hypothetical protein
MSPGGGVDSGRSVKGRNIFLNLKDAASASLSSLPALMALHEKYGKPESGWQVAVAAVIALSGLLKALSSALQVSLTKQTAGVLHTMWLTNKKGEDSVAHAGLLEKVNSQFVEYRWEKIDAEQLLVQLETLERIGCIEKIPYDSISFDRIRWHLLERVKLTY